MAWNAKVSVDFIRESFSGQNTVSYYARTSEAIGLWNSEKTLIEKYFKKDKSILDLGCGTGRTTIELFKLGYKKIEGLDISEKMIQMAQDIALSYRLDIEFKVGNACDLPYPDNCFDNAFFSFNGLMQIPGKQNRKSVMQEVQRVLRPGGIFIFTTHDKESSPEFGKFWRDEETKWRLKKQDKRLIEFGDIIIDEPHQELFIHIATHHEIKDCLESLNWTLLEDIWRPDICEEKPSVLNYSNHNRFWIVQKSKK